MIVNILDSFSEDYAEARDKFARAAKAAEVALQRFDHPRRSPYGRELVTDVARFGPETADRVLVIVSGTHGVEGLGGAACQVGWLTSGGYRRMPEGIAVLLVHLINPYGVAWVQQETMEGVNLNRNYVDHAAPYPEAPLYAQIHDALLCPDLEGERFEAAEAVIADFRARHGMQAFQQALFGGQFHWPEGVNFGGNEATWANKTLIDIIKRQAGAAREVVVLDFHTGLGPYGHGALIVFCAENDALFARASAWFGAAVMRVPGPETVGGIVGQTGSGCIRALSHAIVTPVTVEFGTFDVETECRVVRQDFWLSKYGDRTSDQGRRIKAELREYFYPAAKNWREMVWARSQEVIRDALAGLSSQPR